MNARRIGGFSLLEMLVAMAIMAASLGMLYQASTGALRGVGDQMQQQRAVLLAQSLLNARDAVPGQGWREKGEVAGMTWEVSSNPLALPPGLVAEAPVLHDVSIEIGWAGRQGPKRLQLRTLLPQEPPQPAAAVP